MKTLGISIAILLMACVPLKEYNLQRAKLAAITEENKGIRKEIRSLEKEQKTIKDSIVKRIERNTATATLVKKRLESFKFKLRLDPEAIKGIQIIEPDTDKEFYSRMWNSYTSRDTHAASKVNWLSASEKKIYYYLNYARLNPKEFCNRFVLPKLKYDSNNVYLITLIDYMYTMGPKNALVPDKNQFDAAKCHAESSGKLGYVGHSRQEDACKSRFLGECCSYGLSDPLAIVLQLLIDNGVSSLGHRYICLGWYSGCGIAMAPHKGYGTNVVLDFR